MISAWTFQDAEIDELLVNWKPPEKNRVAFDRLRWGTEEWTI
jgi:hypothetical protein